ncbi:hypothetical protein [Phytoactinopolyspora halotolerans]|uniref:GerMN domain-containing protein n=1 Tax=Phytoactinopolyspora halotolerans TaxID=1981512 RepID=A0A6L9SB62_9ACTN|nr:hypothetical protein [Phytoactinopolyspora halotolerans]NEE01748.1 hypothetical protein [Phytoactinopolyspora halotolerans]
MADGSGPSQARHPTIRGRAALLLTAAALLFGGCGVSPSEVQYAGEAPTGLAEGTTVFFLDDDGTPTPSQRDTGRLGTVLGAVQLLMYGTSPPEVGDGLHTEIPDTTVSPSIVDAGEHVTIRLPFMSGDISPEGIDQIVCTAMGVIAASGRDLDRVEVVVSLTDTGPEERSCPVLG